jgi:ABC-type lipoprotein release transport system permease subunit
VGATRGQVAAVFGWQAVFVAGTGMVAGAVMIPFGLMSRREPTLVSG